MRKERERLTRSRALASDVGSTTGSDVACESTSLDQERELVQLFFARCRVRKKSEIGKGGSLTWLAVEQEAEAADKD